MKTALITIASGRHEHLKGQWRGVSAGAELPHDYIIVAIADPTIADIMTTEPAQAPVPRIVELPTTSMGLPLARARNLGATTALAAGAEVLMFLDVDCIPSPHLLQCYHQAARNAENYLLCGPVAYLPPKPSTGYPTNRLSELAPPHTARPAPPDGHTVDTDDHTLFWSLSFAVTAQTWQKIGGFSEAYLGYGGEDTDFGQRARQAGISLRWVGGATAFHQHHPVSDPPTEHLHDILRNATIFHRTWGWWPMTGWLTEFERLQLIEFNPETHTWVRTTT